ncbi:MAG: hypothetical protein D6803_02465 [Anaerolineae bacterium]|nr:MAG: hypothetical protein D6803_02465 [Anaerolineae bacterium]
MPAQPRPIPPNLRKALLREIDAWEAEGLLNAEQIAALRARYAVKPPASAAAPPQPQPAAEPAPTLSERIFSETSIKIALYLGAFFVIGAALILAALVEVARLPILYTLTVGFGAPALVLRRRLPQPAFAFYLVAGVSLLIIAGVTAEQAAFSNAVSRGYWTATFWGLTLLWAAGVILYCSRLFSLFAFLMGVAGTIALFGWLRLQDAALMPMMAAWCLAGWAGSHALRRRWGAKFARPLFWLAKAVLGFTLLAATSHGFSMWDDYFFRREHPLALLNALTWLIAAADFALTRRRSNRPAFRFAAVAALLPIPWLVLTGLGVRPESIEQPIAQWLWGALLATASLALEHEEDEIHRGYALPALLASGAAFLGALVLPFTRTPTDTLLLFALFLGVALAYAMHNALRPRMGVWAAALAALTGAYFTFFELDFMQAHPVFPGYRLAPIGLLFLLPDITHRHVEARLWRLPPRLLGALLTAGNALYLLLGVPDHFGDIAAIFAAYALFAGAYAVARRRAAYGWAGTLSLMLSLVFALQAWDYDLWVWPLTALAAVCYLSGVLLSRAGAERQWSNLLRYSGLAFAAQAGLSAPFEVSGAWVSVWGALCATLYAIEAWRGRNVWLGFPAAILYLIAYFLLLDRLEVSQPQFYSVGAAALGMVMHYLLTRSGNRWAAFATGMISQLALLSTTYIQMIREENFIYFAVLFAQALVVLGYGVVIRSRSLVIAPIGFVVLAVLTVAFNILQGLSSAALVGCTGVALLLFATLALLLRERWGEVRTRWEGWKP